MTLNDTTRGNRLHIGLFGRRNAGKSSLINALTGQSVATVSSVPGTTTDPVYKAMELHGVGPVVFIDTAGFDDEGELGQLRVEKTEQAIRFSGSDYTAATLGFVPQLLSVGLDTDRDVTAQLISLLSDKSAHTATAS